MPGFRRMNPAPEIALTPLWRWRAQFLEGGEGSPRWPRTVRAANLERQRTAREVRRSGVGQLFRVGAKHEEAYSLLILAKRFSQRTLLRSRRENSSQPEPGQNHRKRNSSIPVPLVGSVLQPSSRSDYSVHMLDKSQMPSSDVSKSSVSRCSHVSAASRQAFPKLA
jgi:hypothetical protein